MQLQLHYIALHNTTLHYTDYIALHYNYNCTYNYRYITLHYLLYTNYSTLHYNYNCTSLHDTPLHTLAALHYITLQYTTLHYATLQYATLH